MPLPVRVNSAGTMPWIMQASPDRTIRKPKRIATPICWG